MKMIEGIWLPDDEQHLLSLLRSSPKIEGRGTYQLAKHNAAMRYVKRWRRAIDVGAHVGLWSMLLVKRFLEVLAFEPAQAHLECLHRNMIGSERNFRVFNCALGDHVDSVGLTLEPGSSGGTHIEHIEDGIAMFPLDDFVVEDVDFIKIDVEGYEYFVVRGAEKTIRKHKPVILIEQKAKGLAERYGQSRFAALDLLKSWGAEVQFEMSGDFCLTWRI